jgi:hypothetical protein
VDSPIGGGGKPVSFHPIPKAVRDALLLGIRPAVIMALSISFGGEDFYEYDIP